MKTPPSGNITFLFTDIEGSTRLSQEYADKMPAALLRHHEILDNAIESNNGFVFKTIGDAYCCAFENAVDALKAAVQIQKDLASEEWDEVQIKIRIGIHNGPSEWNGRDYMGYITLARTARIMSASYGEQILVSNDVYIQAADISGSGISFRDLGERRLKDLIQPIKLFQITADGLREDFPPLKTLDARPNNLPMQLTSFIGREEEIKQIKNKLKQTRLLTLIGSGGTGKTRLSLQIAADIIDEFENGIWFVELASLMEPSLLAQTISQAIGIQENPKEKVEDTLLNFVKDKELLIILDNCEHVIESCANLTEKLLKSSRKLKILTSSREALRCSGEFIHSTLSLKTPDPKDKESAEQLTQYESVRLFIERALSVNSNFRINNENAPALAEICYQLDGIPLALELAAVRTKILSLEKIHGRLNDRFKLLSGGNRTSLPRQQTLRALVDWSFDLLPETEKILWERLSVFSSGWSLEAAEKICSDDVLEEIEIVMLLQNLSEKSIVIFDEKNERYKMLETIRQYGEEKLKDRIDFENISAKYINFYIETAVEANKKLTGLEVKSGMTVLENEAGNIEKCLKILVEKGSSDESLRLSGAMGKYWYSRGHISEGMRWLDIVIENNSDTDSFLKASAMLQAGNLSRHSGEYEKSLNYYRRSLKIYEDADHSTGIANAYSYIGCVLIEQGKFDEAIELFEQSLKIYKDENNIDGIAQILNNIGNALIRGKGDLKKIVEINEEGLALSRKAGNKNLIFSSLSNLGNILMLDTENYNQAFVLFEECLEIAKEIENKPGIAQTLNNLGGLAFLNEDFEKAKLLYNECLITSRDAGIKYGIPLSLLNLGMVSIKQKDFDNAFNLLKECHELFESMGNSKGITESLLNLGDLFINKGEPESGKEYFDKCLNISRESGDKRNYLKAIYGLGLIAFSKGEYESALKYFRESLMISFEVLDYKRTVTNLFSICETYFKQNEFEPAVAILGFLESYTVSKKINLEVLFPHRFEQMNSLLKEKLKDNLYLKLYEDGKSFTREEIIKLSGDK